MTGITKCLNEWNGIIEALGQGEQSILIRKYGTTLDKFLLYPTKTYATNDNYHKFFKKEYETFVDDNLLPTSNDKNEYEVKYLAKVEDILPISSKIGRYDDYHIWNKKHVSDYFRNKKANIWLLRIYELDKPAFLSRTKGMIYANG